MCVTEYVRSGEENLGFSVVFSDSMSLPVFGGVTGTWCHSKPFVKEVDHLRGSQAVSGTV